jgi:hypothetical protein
MSETVTVDDVAVPAEPLYEAANNIIAASGATGYRTGGNSRVVEVDGVQVADDGFEDHDVYVIYDDRLLGRVSLNNIIPDCEDVLEPDPFDEWFEAIEGEWSYSSPHRDDKIEVEDVRDDGTDGDVEIRFIYDESPRSKNVRNRSLHGGSVNYVTHNKKANNQTRWVVEAPDFDE